ncbi:xylulokinase [Marisediminicola sp. LYQ134]|uniref:xylulokinase n=1 Tax=Marisediminicola sp. LYQ134 TaxID=3391061 RepID=UPI003983A601
MSLVAGIDSSTQSCKVVIRDSETGALVREGRASHLDGTEIDPQVWVTAMFAAIADAGGFDDVAAVSIAGQQHGLVCLADDGTVVRDALLWNDTRSASSAADLVAELGASTWAEATGAVPVASFTATKLRWVRDNEPETVAATAAVALPHDYLTWRLLGYGPGRADLGALTTDRSDASGTSYWSPASDDYRTDLLEHALGKTVALPRVLGPADAAGITDGSVEGIPAGIVVGAGAGDNAGAALGLGAGAGDVVVSIGTSGTVFAVTDDPVSDASGTVAGFADATGRFLPLVATLNAARVMTAATRILGVDNDGLSRLALAAPAGSAGIVHLPYLEGERTPNLPDATGSLVGLTLANSLPENIARAMIEGLLCGLADGLAAITDQGVEVRRVLLIGGGAKNAAVRAIAPQVFGVDVTTPPESEYVADGAARGAAWALTGVYPEWTVGDPDVETSPEQPIIREQYAAAQRAAGISTAR